MLDKLINLLKDLLAPKKCYLCKCEWHFLCKKCSKKIPSFNSICYICKETSYKFNVHGKCKDNIFFDKIIVLYHYKIKIINKLIKDWKFYNKKDIFTDFWDLMSKKLKENIDFFNNEDYIIIPTPLHFFKRFKRWYNQSYIISKQISYNTWINVNKNLVYKAKHTRQQSQLSKIDRINNLQNSFKINKKQLDIIDNYKNKTVIIVDDVISTGTTINEISKILKEVWFKNIIWLVIASD